MTTSESSQTNTTRPKNKDKKSKKMTFKKKIGILLINIVVMIILLFVIIWGALTWLKDYTRRADVIQTPDLIGMTEYSAQDIMNQDELNLVIADSVYNANAVPGAIIETVPSPGTMIKKGRTIFATINAVSIMNRQIPNINEVSMRQAEAMLSAIGFANVTIKYVGGTYKDLAIRITREDGTILSAGEKVPYDTPLILEISSDDPTLLTQGDSIPSDSIANPSSQEGWF